MRLHRNLLGDYSPQLSLKNMHLDGFRRKLDFRMHWNTFSGLSRCSSSVWLCTITSSMYTKHWCGSRSRSTCFIMRWNEELFVISREFWRQDNFWSLKIYCCQLWPVSYRTTCRFLPQQYTNIVSFLLCHLSTYNVSWGRLLETSIVSLILSFVLADIVSFRLCHGSNIIVSCGRTLEAFIVSSISCIDQHCVISIESYVDQHCVVPRILQT